MSITRGLTFGTTEQITNTKLHSLVDNSTISLEYDELSDNMLTSLPSAAGILPTSVFVSSLASGSLLRFDGGTGWYAATS